MLAPHHLVIDLYECSPAILASVDEVREYISSACWHLNLKPRGAPLIDKFPDPPGTVDLPDPPKLEGKGGITACQVIETSLIGIHTYPENGTAYIDIFSCDLFNHVKGIAMTKRFFQAKRVKWSLVDRSPPFTTPASNQEDDEEHRTE